MLFRSAQERDQEKQRVKLQAFECELETIPSEKRVYIDEAGSNLGMSRSHARSLRGERQYSKKPASRGGNISMVGAVRLRKKFFVHPFDGPVDGERFLEFLEKLCPTLSPGDVVIMDNCRIHHIEAVSKKLASVGARALYLPPYSPELNPIEEVWALIKGILKSLEPRNIVDYVTALYYAAGRVTHEKIEGYFRHSDSFLSWKPAQVG